jgi:hypothetical protein
MRSFVVASIALACALQFGCGKAESPPAPTIGI